MSQHRDKSKVSFEKLTSPMFGRWAVNASYHLMLLLLRLGPGHGGRGQTGVWAGSGRCDQNCPSKTNKYPLDHTFGRAQFDLADSVGPTTKNPYNSYPAPFRSIPWRK